MNKKNADKQKSSNKELPTSGDRVVIDIKSPPIILRIPDGKYIGGLKVESITVLEGLLVIRGWSFGNDELKIKDDTNGSEFYAKRYDREDVLSEYNIKNTTAKGFEIIVSARCRFNSVLHWVVKYKGQDYYRKYQVAVDGLSIDENEGSAKVCSHRECELSEKANLMRDAEANNFPLRQGGRDAAVTIVSKNYISQAAVLAASYKQHHPDNDFIIILVDRLDGYVFENIPDKVSVIGIEDIGIPDVDRFIYRYSIMELNTAVKPYAMSFLFEVGNYSTLLYIDPDILVFRYFSEVYDALNLASIVLIPHLRQPIHDDCKPSELSILQSGTYNLGFLGLANKFNAHALLSWWKEKLYLDCIVDIPNGLFVDQKWLDLVPGFFPDHKIIYDKTYNVAYWNLHERNVTYDNNKWYVDGANLTFFHFSGFTPLSPNKLSKHQNRHLLNNGSALASLANYYGQLLLDFGYLNTSKWPYSFEILHNGTKIPLALVRDVMQWCARNNVQTPSPVQQPDEFCRFLMKKGVHPEGSAIPLIFYFLLKRRPDVLNAFPNALNDAADPGFRDWIFSSGIKEEKITDLLPYEYSSNDICNVSNLFKAIRSSGQAWVLEKYKDYWFDNGVLQKFSDWFNSEGKQFFNFNSELFGLLESSRKSVLQILHLYYLRGDLQLEYKDIHKEEVLLKFLHWLRQNKYKIGIDEDGLYLFYEFALGNSELLSKAQYLYYHSGRRREVSPNIYNIKDVLRGSGFNITYDEIISWLAKDNKITPIDHYVSNFGVGALLKRDFDKCSVFGLSESENYEFVEKILTYDSDFKAQRVINFAGYISSPTGMGESARSMQTILDSLMIKSNIIELPNPRVDVSEIKKTPFIFGWPDPQADISITIANADSSSHVSNFLPPSYWAKKNVGYWVWETESLPDNYIEPDKNYDEIWTPSFYSATAIKKSISKPVRVIPHSLDFDLINAVNENRKLFNLPDDACLFGFAFDPSSVLERKNVKGLIKAFSMAFCKSDNCFLVIKVNSANYYVYEYELLKSMIRNSKIIIIEKTLTKLETLSLIKSFDAYVSLHRSEGFGLTCAEAMALGVPVIASDYSGNLEFMSNQDSLLVPTKVIETDRPYGPYPAGTKWGDPDLEVASTLMRQLLDVSFRVELGKKARKAIQKKLSPARLGKIVNQGIDELLH